MSDLFKRRSVSNEHWLENLDKIQDSARKKYFSTLPDEDQLKKFFSEAFIINNPKGRVGGDGYWLHTNGNDLYLAIFTCVGDGHLANMMIRIYIDALKKMVEGYAIDFPGSMLQFLHREVIAKFKDKNNILLNTNTNVGIVKINSETKQMEFAGANMDLIQVEQGGKARVINGEERQVGESNGQVKSFPSIAIENTKSSVFYLCSTGVFNLIGGSKFKKLSPGELAGFLREKKKSALQEQKIQLSEFFSGWTGSSGQNDDIMVIGFRP